MNSPYAVFKISAVARTLTVKIWVGPVRFPSFIIYKFCQNCASVWQVSDLILKTAYGVTISCIWYYELSHESNNGLYINGIRTLVVSSVRTVLLQYFYGQFLLNITVFITMVTQLFLVTKHWAGPVKFDPAQVKIIKDYTMS